MNTPTTPAKLLAPADPCEDARHQPDWWAPVWQGLVLDRQGRHYAKIKSALWLLIYFILCADRRTGSLKRKISTISQGMGVKSRTIRTCLQILLKGGYIEKRTNGRCLVITIRKWKTYAKGHLLVRQSGESLSGRMTELCQSQAIQQSQESPSLSQISAVPDEPNDITIKKEILKNDNDSRPQPSATKEDITAWKIAQAFKDKDNLPLYLSYARKYSPEIIQKAYQEVMKQPLHKIKKSRGALFNYLVKHYGEK